MQSILSVARAESTVGVECQKLLSVVNNWKTDFVELAGRESGPSEWEATVALPGQDRCYIRKSKSISYVCETASFKSRAEALAAAKGAFAKAQACLGGTWQRNQAMEEFFFALNDDENERSLIVSVTQAISPDVEYIVMTQVYRKFQQPLEPQVTAPEAFDRTAYCDDLKAVVQDGRSQFSSLIEEQDQQAADGTRVHYLSKTQLKDWEDCYVHETRGKPQCRYLTCRRGPFIDIVTASKAVEQTSSDVASCLGAAWRPARTRQTDNTISIRLIGDAADPYIEVRPSQSLYSGAWNMRLYIMLDFESCD